MLNGVCAFNSKTTHDWILQFEFGVCAHETKIQIYGKQVQNTACWEIDTKSWKFFPYPSLCLFFAFFFYGHFISLAFFLLRRVIKLLLEKITMKQSTISSWGFLILSAAFWVVRHTAWTKQFLQMKQHDFLKRPTNALIEDYKKIYKKERYEKEGKKHSDFFRLFRNLTSGLWTTVCCSIPFTPRLKINVTCSIQKLLFRFRCRFCGCILKWWRLSTQ